MRRSHTFSFDIIPQTHPYSFPQFSLNTSLTGNIVWASSLRTGLKQQKRSHRMLSSTMEATAIFSGIHLPTKHRRPWSYWSYFQGMRCQGNFAIHVHTHNTFSNALIYPVKIVSATVQYWDSLGCVAEGLPLSLKCWEPHCIPHLTKLRCLALTLSISTQNDSWCDPDNHCVPLLLSPVWCPHLLPVLWHCPVIDNITCASNLL